MIPVRSERIYSIQSALKCARREFKFYIFTEVYDVTLVRAWRCSVSANRDILHHISIRVSHGEESQYILPYRFIVPPLFSTRLTKENIQIQN